MSDQLKAMLERCLLTALKQFQQANYDKWIKSDFESIYTDDELCHTDIVVKAVTKS